MLPQLETDYLALGGMIKKIIVVVIAIIITFIACWFCARYYKLYLNSHVFLIETWKDSDYNYPVLQVRKLSHSKVICPGSQTNPWQHQDSNPHTLTPEYSLLIMTLYIFNWFPWETIVEPLEVMFSKSCS